jgi:hypothetical protein
MSRNDQCKVAGVKGISDAVRGAVNTWVTEPLLDLLWKEFSKTKPSMTRSTFGYRVRNAEAWSRYKRGNEIGPGFWRLYYCKEFGAKGVVDLKVLTNGESKSGAKDADMRITYVLFYVNGKMVYGGAVDVPSTLFQKFGYVVPAQIDVAMKAGIKTTAAFVPFTEKQLAKLATQYEFGGMSAIDRMFDERV